MSNFELGQLIGPVNYYYKLDQETACWRNFPPEDEIEPDDPSIIHVPIGAIAIGGIVDDQTPPLFMAEINQSKIVTVINRELNMTGVAHLPPGSDYSLIDKMFYHSPNLIKQAEPRSYVIGQGDSLEEADRLTEKFSKLGLDLIALHNTHRGFVSVSCELGDIFLNDYSGEQIALYHSS